jgi:hypothetical protein
MELTPGDLLEFGAQPVWPDNDLPTTLVRVDGPSLAVVSGTLVFGAPLFWEPSVMARVDLPPGRLATVFTDVEGPPIPRAPNGVHRLTAAGAGDLDAVVEWQEALDDAGRPLVFNVEYAVGCMFDLDRADQVERALADPGRADELYRRTIAGLTAPIEVDGEVVAVAFNNGMGESTSSVFVGLDAQGRAVAALADLEVLHHADRRIGRGHR